MQAAPSHRQSQPAQERGDEMRTSRMMLATAIVALGLAILAVPAAAGTTAQDDDADGGSGRLWPDAP